MLMYTTLGCLVYSLMWMFRRVFCSPIVSVTTVLTNPVWNGLFLTNLDVRVMFLGCVNVTVLLLSLEDPGLGPPQDRNQTAGS